MTTNGTLTHRRVIFTDTSGVAGRNGTIKRVYDYAGTRWAEVWYGASCQVVPLNTVTLI